MAVKKPVRNKVFCFSQIVKQTRKEIRPSLLMDAYNNFEQTIDNNAGIFLISVLRQNLKQKQIIKTMYKVLKYAD